MKDKKLILAAFFAALTVLLSACSDSSKLTMGTGAEDSDRYSLGDAIAYYVGQDEDTDVSVTVAASSGSVATIQGIDAGTYRLGIVRADLLDAAWNGTGAFEGAAVQSCRAVAELYTETVQLVTMNTDIDSVADLAGHIVCVGEEGSDTYYSAMDMLSAAGLGAEILPDEISFVDEETGEALTSADVLSAAGLSTDAVGLRYMSVSDGVDALKNGTADAMFFVSAVPTAALTELCADNTVTFISPESSVIATLTENNPAYCAYTLAKNTYNDQSTAVSTVSVKTVLIVSAAADEDTIYDLTKLIFSNMSGISDISDVGSELSIASAVSDVDIPYHSGAARYFAEQGYSVATE